MEKKLLIIGTHGHRKVVLEAALSTSQYKTITFMTNDMSSGGIKGYPLLDQTKTPIEYIQDNFDEVIVAVGINNKARLRVSTELEKQGIQLATIIHSTAAVSKFTTIHAGTVIAANAVVNPFTTIGKACIIGTGAIVGHDCILSDGVHLSPNATVAGTVHIGKNTWICMGSNVVHETTVGENVVVGAGAVVLKDVPDNVMVAGIPATIRKEYNQK